MSQAKQAVMQGRSRGRRFLGRREQPAMLTPQAIPLLAVVAGTVALALAGALLAAQMLAGPSAIAEPARPGDAVRIPGGLLRVDEVTPESMAPMQMEKFARSGMSMSGIGMDMAPEGYRRFSVAVTITGEGSAGLRFAPDQIRLEGENMPEVGPVRYQIGDGAVPRGHAVSGSLTFQAPEKASGLSLRFPGAERAILLEPAAPGASHDHHDHEEGGTHDH